MESEVLIVGGGVAGLALAARLGRQGRAVTVVDKAALPRDKVCGEGVMPMGLEQLRRWGLDPTQWPGAGFAGLEYRTARRAATLTFSGGAQGRGMRRTTLIAALDRWSREQPGVTHVSDAIVGPLWRGERIAGVRGRRENYHAPVIVAADGVHSPLAHAVGAPIRPQGERMGLRQHFRVRGGQAMERVWVGLFAPYDLYLTPVDGETFLATLMTNRAGYRRVVDDYGGFLGQSPFAGHFEEVEPAGRQLGWHHPLFSVKRFAHRGLLLAGDAGGGVDPCLGVGISMALASVALAEACVLGILAEPHLREAHEQRFDRERKKLFQHFSRFGRIFRLMIRSSPGGEALLLGMTHWPAVAGALLDIVALGRPWSTFPWPALLHPLPFGPNGPARRGMQATARAARERKPQDR